MPLVLVFGDVILDRYTWGHVGRISPEAPVPILRQERDEYRLGGAAAVAALLSTLGANVVCVGVTGRDSSAETFDRLLRESGVAWNGVHSDDGRPTTTKQRFLSSRHGHTQLLRVDCESENPVNSSVSSALWEKIRPQIEMCDAVVVSDYGKGACRTELLQQLIVASASVGTPILVDPARRADMSDYSGATALVPNRHETELAANTTIGDPVDALRLGSAFCRRWNVRGAFVKLDSDGIVLLRDTESARHFPIRPLPVFDVTGAGDTVIAVLAMCLSTGQSWDTACRLANLAGGAQVRQVGVASLSRDDLLRELDEFGNPDEPEGRIVSLARAAERSAAARAQGRTVVFTNGCFAAIHAGHIDYLRAARGLGDLLIVACNSTESIRRLKGDRPVIPDADRARMLASLEFVDCVLVFDDDTPHRLLEAIQPNVLVKGGTTDVIIGREVVERMGGKVFRLPALPGISTTQLLTTPGAADISSSIPPDGCGKEISVAALPEYPTEIPNP